MELITHTLKAPEAKYYFFMGSNGECFFKIYQYSDDDTFCVFSELSVSDSFRQKGIGNYALNTAIDLSKSLNCKYLYLWVEKSSWMFDWYKRKGFIQREDFKDIQNNVWMRLKITEK